MHLIQQLKKNIEKYVHQYGMPEAILIALSGGADSVVLLHAMVQLKLPFLIRAVHVNHHLQKDADLWAQWVIDYAQSLGVESISRDVFIDTTLRESLEEIARDARYEIFESLMAKNFWLCTAHHADDQAETVFLQLMRGSGVAGLAAIPEVSSCGLGLCLRPFLNMTRNDILSYATEMKLSYIQDPSNADVRFARNFFRHTISPLLQKRYPNFPSAVARSAAHLGEALALLDEMAALDCKSCLLSEIKIRQVRAESGLNIDLLFQLSETRRKNALRYWMSLVVGYLPSTVQLSTIINEVLLARSDASPVFSIEGKWVFRYQKAIYFYSVYPKDYAGLIISWDDISLPLELPDELGVLSPLLTCLPELSAFSQDSFSKVSVRFRSGGERLCPAGRQGSHPLKKLFQEWGVPPWLRGQIPLIYVEEELVEVILNIPKVFPREK